MKHVKLYANAKINLFLDIESKRTDGYHNISSLMQSVDLFDIVDVSYEESEKKIIEISVNDPKIPSNEKNIAYKAADRLLDSGIVKIDIQKNIPSPAGLAGGSADAAAVIYALRGFGCIDKSDADEITPEAELSADLGINSIELANLVLICEEQFDLMIDDEDLTKFITVGDVADYLEKHC